MTFQEALHLHGLELTRNETDWLQINVGLVCDLACKHCHLEAGPTRTELMSLETVEAVIDCARRFRFATIDITGGAPELLPDLPRLVTGLAPLTQKLIVRSNLVALSGLAAAGLPDLYRQHRVAIVASLPSIASAQTDAQRGAGVWARSIEVLQRLNALGYGRDGSGLVLDIAANPTGAFLPVSQPSAEQRYRQELQRRHGVVFDSLLTFANVPLGRFRRWLEHSGNLADYLGKLQGSFNPCTLSGLMCCSLLSVNWDGYIYDCDFNLAADLPLGGNRRHIATLKNLPRSGTPIAVGDHCFACTAGAGFTCGGSIAA